MIPRLKESVRYSETLIASAPEIIAAGSQLGLEGVIAKRKDSLYEAGCRSSAWVKMRVNRGQEFVIGGYVPSPKSFESLVIGHYEDGKLMFAARVRTGLTSGVQEQIFRELRRLARTSFPFANLSEAKRSRWAKV